MTEGLTSGNGDPVRFAVVGCGVIGRVHARAIRRAPDAELAAVADCVESAAKEVAREYGGLPVSGIEEVLERDDVDAVAICTPSGEHAAPAVQALRAGKHVVVEKPVDVSVAAAEALHAAVVESGRTATVISQHRFDPASIAVHEAVRDGRFGRLTSGVASIAWWRSESYYASGDWRGTWALDGGGALMNQGIHTIDLLVWMFGRPVEVSAYAGCLAHDGIDVEDTAVALMRFENGALGAVHGTTAAYPGLSARIQVHGSRGSAIIDDDQLVFFHAARDGVIDATAPAYGAGLASNQAATIPSGDRSCGDGGAGANPSRLSDAHDLQYADFLRAVRTGREPKVTVASATTTLRVILAIYQSATEGRPVKVRL
ncbi:MAG: Gfo/Idh/MocA family oxidoreductase [Acidimicrobiaceae bacterium]|nr:Gfo/Idh/MocA family oxidoreductase [Acidimicrobiaceae bacterium]